MKKEALAVLLCLCLCGFSACTKETAQSPSASSGPGDSLSPSGAEAGAPGSAPLGEVEGPLTAEDFDVYEGGRSVLRLTEAEYQSFSFDEAAVYGLDETATVTRRGAGIGHTSAELARRYPAVPVSVQGADGSILRYDDLDAYLDSAGPAQSYMAAMSFYLIDGQPVYDTAVIDETARKNREEGALYEMFGYAAVFYVQDGVIGGISLSLSDETPYEVGSIQPTVLWEDEDLTVTATSIRSAGYLVEVGITFENRSARAVTAVCGQVMANGRPLWVNAQTEGAFLYEAAGPGETVQGELNLLTAALRLAGVERIDSVEVSLTLLPAGGEAIVTDLVALPVA